LSGKSWVSSKMSLSESRFEEVVADTVVVNYFLAVGRIDLLVELVGGMVRVPKAVYDREDAGRQSEIGLSELEKGLRRHRLRAVDAELPPGQRERSRQALPHFEQLPELVDRGFLAPQ